MIDRNFTVELLGRVDIVDLINRYVPLKKAGANEVACCPFHQEKTPSFTVSADKQFYHCFGCGVHGNVIQFVMDYLGLDFVNAIEHLASTVGMTVQHSQQHYSISKKSDTTKDFKDHLREINKKVADYFYHQRHHSSVVDYLCKRQLSAEIIDRYQVGFAPYTNYLNTLFSDSFHQLLLTADLMVQKEKVTTTANAIKPRFRHRLMFPIRDIQGSVVGFGARVLDKSLPKYLNSAENPLFNKSKSLYGLFEAKTAIRQRKKVVVVEGYMDVLALAQHGVDYVVATLGTATTQQHIQQLFRFADQIYFCFDGDQAGRKAAWKALTQALTLIKENKHIYFIFLPDGQDPDEFVRHHGQKVFENLINEQAWPLSRYFLQTLTQGNAIKSAEAQSLIISQAAKLFTLMPDSTFKDLLIKALAEQLDITLGQLQPLLGQTTTLPSQPKSYRCDQWSRQWISQEEVTSHNKKMIYWLLTKPYLATYVHLPDYLEYGEDIHCLLALTQAVLESQGQVKNTAQLLELFKDSPFYSLLAKVQDSVFAHESERASEVDSEEEFKVGLTKIKRDIFAKELAELRSLIKTDSLDEGQEALLQALINKRLHLRRPCQPFLGQNDEATR